MNHRVARRLREEFYTMAGGSGTCGRIVDFHGPAVHQIYISEPEFNVVVAKGVFHELWVEVTRPAQHDLIVFRDENSDAFTDASWSSSIFGIFEITDVDLSNQDIWIRGLFGF